jgi:hypothetical protein
VDKAVQFKDAVLKDVAFTPEFSNTQGDPHWLQFLGNIDRPSEQLAAIDFKVNLPKWGGQDTQTIKCL